MGACANAAEQEVVMFRKNFETIPGYDVLFGKTKKDIFIYCVVAIGWISLIVGVFSSLGCRSEFSVSDRIVMGRNFPYEGCVAHRENGQQFERVIILAEHSETEWEVRYPDSFSDTIYILEKSKVRLNNCPGFGTNSAEWR